MNIKLNYWLKYRETNEFIYLRHIVDSYTEKFINVKINKQQAPVICDGLYWYRDMYTDNLIGFNKVTKDRVSNCPSDDTPFIGVYQILLPVNLPQNCCIKITNSFIIIITASNRVVKIHYTAKWNADTITEQYNLLEGLADEMAANNANTKTPLYSWLKNYMQALANQYGDLI